MLYTCTGLNNHMLYTCIGLNNHMLYTCTGLNSAERVKATEAGQEATDRRHCRWMDGVGEGCSRTYWEESWGHSWATSGHPILRGHLAQGAGGRGVLYMGQGTRVSSKKSHKMLMKFYSQTS